MSVPASVSFVKSTLQRAAELEQKEPVVSYYCKLHAAQQILATKLHQQDAEVKEFATNLLSEIEDARASDVLTTPQAAEIVQNDDVAQAYVTNFANNVFERAARAVDENRATKATAQTFLAAATFLELQQIWDKLEDETRQQIKYAKFQAARILKALKNGEDPNEPQAEAKETPAAESGTLGPEAPEESEIEQSEQPEESEIEASEQDLPEPPSHPVLPNTPANIPDVTLPDAPDAQPNDLGLPRIPGSDPSVPFDYDAPPIKPSPSDFTKPTEPTGSTKPAKPAKPEAPPTKSSKPSNSTKPVVAHPINLKSVMAEAATTTAAQKHAKYAISALNYDDIDTAMSELTKALAILREFKSQ